MRFPWNRAESQLNREVAHHLQELTAEYVRQGYSPEDAARQARKEFGGAGKLAHGLRLGHVRVAYWRWCSAKA
jgi:hypothetical protein